MKETRIKEIIIDEANYFYPQYLGWFKRWRNFRNCGPYYDSDFCFKTLAEAREFLRKINHKSVVKVSIHDEESQNAFQ